MMSRVVYIVHVILYTYTSILLLFMCVLKLSYIYTCIYKHGKKTTQNDLPQVVGCVHVYTVCVCVCTCMRACVCVCDL